jgi:integrase
MPPRTRRRRGYVEQLPSGSFRAVVYAGVDPLTGKYTYVRETRKTRADAEKELTRLQRDVDLDKQADERAAGTSPVVCRRRS